MTEQYQFQSEDHIVTVEIDNGDLVFVDYDIQYDIAAIEFGYPPTTAVLLSWLWSDPNPGWAFNVCMGDNSEFEVFGQWHSLTDTEARMILSYSMSPGDRGSVAANGIGFTLEQRIQMTAYEGASEAVATFLIHYEPSRGRTRGAYPDAQQRAMLYQYLTPDDKWQVVLHAPMIDDNESLDLVTGSNDRIRLAALRLRPFTIKHKRELAILNSIEDDGVLAEALCQVKFIEGQEFKNQARRIKDRNWLCHVAHHAKVPEAMWLLHETDSKR